MFRRLFTAEEDVPFSSEPKFERPDVLMRLGIGIVVVLCLGVLAVSLGFPGPKASQVISLGQNEQPLEDGNTVNQTERCVYVHLLGCVNNPGVYECKEGSRLSDVVDLAGGLSEDAAEESVNLAALVEDGTQITVLSKDQVSSNAEAPNQAGQNTPASSNGKININTASVEELTSLNGIGVATAEKIVSYREKNGKFSSIQELTNVSGIGEKRLESLRDHITV